MLLPSSLELLPVSRRVATVMLNWNGKMELATSVPAVLASEQVRNELLVVDNGSRDGSVAWLRKHYPELLLFENKTNCGFSRGSNIGIRAALGRGSDYIFLLNNDTRLERDCIKNLLNYAENHQEAGIFGAKILMYHNPSYINSTGVNLNCCGYGWDRDFFHLQHEVTGEAGPVLSVSGCAMLIKKEVIEQIGLLDESFFAYFEDVDFCLRTWAGGFEVHHVPEAIVYHKFSASAGFRSFWKEYWMERNQIRLMMKHYPAPDLFRYLPKVYRTRLGQAHRLCRQREYDSACKRVLALIPDLRMMKDLGLSLVRRRPGWWNLLDGSDGAPKVREFRAEHALIRGNLSEIESAELLTHRVIMGVSDHVLGPGWSFLEQDFPAFRKLENASAVLFFRSPRPARVLQLHILHGTADLEIQVEGDRHLLPRPPHSPVTHKLYLKKAIEGIATVRFSTSGVVHINEVSLLEQDSPLLR